MQAIGNIINKVKDGYLKAAQWIVEHPHIAMWSAFGAIVVLAVL